MPLITGSKGGGLGLTITTLQLIKRIKTLKYADFLPFKGQMSSNISHVSIFKSNAHVPYICKVNCAFQTQKPAK